MATKKARNISDEERERRRQWALNAHQEIVVDPETGVERRRFGGPQRSSSPKKGQDLVDALFEKLDEAGVQREFVQALVGSLKPEKGVNANLRGVKMILELIAAQQKQQLEEAKLLESLGRDELMARIAGSLERMGIGGAVKSSIDGEGEEVTDADEGEHSGARGDRPGLPVGRGAEGAGADAA